MLRSVLTAAVLAAASILTLGTGSASAAQPCWRTLINDWYDGHIDGSYPLSCYRAALKNAPEDLRIYSDLPNDLQRAMQAIIRSRSTSAGSPSTSPSSSSNESQKRVPADARHTKKSSPKAKPKSS